MGNCAKSPAPTRGEKRESAGPLDKYFLEPEDTALYASRELPTIDLRPLLRKVKVKNSPQRKVGVRFLIGGADEIVLPEKQVEETKSVKWEIQESFQYHLTQYELRKRFLGVQLTSGGSVLGQIKINMYLISVGPYHLDFQIPTSSLTRPRVSFDFKVSQIVNMRIETESLEIYSMKQFVGEQYAFRIKTIIGNNPKVSEMSPVFKVLHEEQGDRPEVTWNRESSSMPFISGSVPFYEFHYATLKCTIFKIDRMSNQPPNDVAECYISFVKLLGFDSASTITKDKTSYEIKHIQLQERLWNSGKQCGLAKIKLRFEIQTHLKQMLVCVRTENGIVKIAPVFQDVNRNSKVINKELSELEAISQKLLLEEGELQKRREKAIKSGTFQNNFTGLTKQSYHILESNLESLKTILQKSKKQSIAIYEYANEQQMIIGQNFLLKLGDRLLRYINEGEQNLTNLKWKVINVLVQRGELSLNYIGSQLDKDNNPAYLKKKREVQIKFQQFQYRLLELTLKTLGMKGYSEQKKFAELYSAMAYMRIPQFRQRLLGLIDKSSDPQINQWRGTDFSLKETSKDFKTYLPGQNTFQLLFDWERQFYDSIKNEPDYQVNLRKLRQVFDNNEQWEVRISKRGGAFFAFVREWAAFVSRVNVRIVHSNWKYYPGYIQIIKSLMAEMKIRKIKQYPPSIKAACGSLLANENLLNTFISILFNKTSVNSNFDVIKILDLTSSFFTALKQQNKRIPSTFNYAFFYKGVKLVIQNLYSYSTAKALHLLYEHFQCFSYEFKIELCNYLLGKLFFKLFLHWSYNVRVIFHHLMAVRVHKFFTGQLKVTDLDTDTRKVIRNISSRYSDLLIVLENVYKMKQQRYIPSTEDELYKKLRNTLRKKRKSIRTGETQSRESTVTLEHIPSMTLAESSFDRVQMSRVMTELARPQLERYDSQVITNNIQIALAKEGPNKPKDEIIRKRINSQEGIENETPHAGKKAIIAMNTQEQVSMPMLSQEDVKYVVLGMGEFNATTSTYLELINRRKGEPTLKMEIMLDSSEMKPQEYIDADDW